MIRVIGKVWFLSVLLFGVSVHVNADDAKDTFLHHLNAEASAELIANNPDIVILDVRTPVEFWRSHIKNAININYYSFSFKSKLSKLDRNKTYLVHCQTGVRSGKSIPIMQAAGFTKLYHMDGGFKAWKNANLPST